MNKAKSHSAYDDVTLLTSIETLLLRNCGYQTDRKIYDQSQIALSANDPRAFHVLCVQQNYKFAFARRLTPRFAWNQV